MDVITKWPSYGKREQAVKAEMNINHQGHLCVEAASPVGQVCPGNPRSLTSIFRCGTRTDPEQLLVKMPRPVANQVPQWPLNSEPKSPKTT